MLDDPLFTAELIAEKRDREDAAWREQYRDLKAREAWHALHSGRPDYVLHVAFADCNSPVCRGETPIPGAKR